MLGKLTKGGYLGPHTGMGRFPFKSLLFRLTMGTNFSVIVTVFGDNL